MDPAGNETRRPLRLRYSIACCIVLCIILLIAALLVLHPLVRYAGSEEPVHVKILAVNDFHGQVPNGTFVNGRPTGSAPVLASYLHAAENESPADATFIAFPGDLIGASPPESGLLLDEPAILFSNTLARGCCGGSAGSCTESGNLIATLGNHEFDQGVPAMLRLIRGGNGTTTITHLSDPYPGSKAAYVCANVVWTENKTPLFTPYVIRDAGGAKIAFVGTDTIQTPAVSSPEDMKGITFENESEAINRYVPEIQAQGVHAIVALIHEGGSGDAYNGPTRNNATVSGKITEIVGTLDPDVDVVLSAHTHKFTNAYLNNSGNRPVLVTQAYSYSRAFADIDLEIDPATDEIVNKSAQIVPAYADQPPGTTPDPEAAALLSKADAVVSGTTDKVEAVAAENITRDETPAGESALGDLLADSERSVMHADAAFITTGSLRADIAKGNVTWGDLYAVQPFSNRVYAVAMTGRQIKSVLEQQWTEPLPPYPLAVSGLTYSYDPDRPAGDRVTAIAIGGVPVNESATYRVAIVSYLVTGGDNYTEFTNTTILEPGPLDVEALSAYISSLPQPVTPAAQNRIAVA